MLSELSLDEVFSSRLQQESYFTPEIDAENGTEVEVSSSVNDHKSRLQTLFKQTVAQVLAKESTE